MTYTQAQIDKANAVDLEKFLRAQGETLVRSGKEYRWKAHDSLTVCGNKWFRHSRSKGGFPVDFVMEFYGVPERGTVCISGRRIRWQHDFGVDKLFLLVVEFRFLVVLAEQPFAALVGCASNSRLPLAAFYDGNFEVRTRHRHHPQTKRPPSKIALDERSGIVFGFARRLGAECCALRSQAGAAKG